MTAQYQLTETVTEINITNGLFVARVHCDEKPIQIPTGWMSFQPRGDYWYLIKGGQVFQSSTAPDLSAAINTDVLPLAFVFPLTVNQSWCPERVDLKMPTPAPITNCDYGGKYTVLQQTDYKVPAGSFGNCFQIDQPYNDGVTIQWFCQDIGVVEIKYDHNGTTFGFDQLLTGYSKGSQ